MATTSWLILLAVVLMVLVQQWVIGRRVVQSKIWIEAPLLEVRAALNGMMSIQQATAQALLDEINTLQGDLATAAQQMPDGLAQSLDALKADLLAAVGEVSEQTARHAERQSKSLGAMHARINNGLLAEAPAHLTTEAVTAAVYVACIESGLDAAKLRPTFDLTHTGKLNEILTRTARALHYRVPFQTVGDVTTYFTLLSETLASTDDDPKEPV